MKCTLSLSKSLSSRPEYLLREAKQMSSGGTCFWVEQGVGARVDVELKSASEMPPPSQNNLVIPTNGKACPEFAELDLQFGFWAQGFSPAIKAKRPAALAAEVRFVSGHGFSRAISIATRAPLAAEAGT